MHYEGATGPVGKRSDKEGMCFREPPYEGSDRPVGERSDTEGMAFQGAGDRSSV
ncbi:MAG: hypothetical protein P4L51_28605 [Puia sp.]|nr:hypothetical protein [Puia sp.]